VGARGALTGVMPRKWLAGESAQWGYRDEIEAGAVKADPIIPCREHLDQDGAVCRGFFDRHKKDVAPLRLAIMLKVVKFI
jgi:hypothetical protein